MTANTDSSSPVRRFSKSSSFYFETKRDFFEENAKLLASVLRKNRLYAAQPMRTCCKICRIALSETADFEQHDVAYVFCDNCSHLNGRFEDTPRFTEEIYTSDDGTDYAAAYIDENFDKRAEDIYLPKVNFLLEHLPSCGPTLLDVGCGGGYFVYASRYQGIDAKGIDVSRSMVRFGNTNISERMGVEPLSFVDEDGFFYAIGDCDAEVVSTIGVIEHLREPHRLFEAFRQSRARYLFYSVPMFSTSVAIENAFDDVFPRQLAGGHTHLFTEESIQELNRQIGVSPVAEWRFGADILDLFRSLMVKLQRNGASHRTTQRFAEGFAAQIDPLQTVLDRGFFCSEIHALVRKI